MTNDLVTEDWHRPPTNQKTMTALLGCAGQPATRKLIVPFGCMIQFAGLAIFPMPSLRPARFWLAHGAILGLAMDPRWHECGRDTASRTRWVNKVVFRILGLRMIRDPCCWKFGRALRHSDTIKTGRDPEAAIMRPVVTLKVAANPLGNIDVIEGGGRIFAQGAGRIVPDEAEHVEWDLWAKIIQAARVWLAIRAVTVAAAQIFLSRIPALPIGLARSYGVWHMVICGWLQHGGRADNCLDHRLNRRSVFVSPVGRFACWNMNCDEEHQVFPLVPYCKMPDLHEACRHSFPRLELHDGQRLRRDVAGPLASADQFRLPPPATRAGDREYLSRRVPRPCRLRKEETMPWPNGSTPALPATSKRKT